jgi:hypothetical protein
MFPFLKYGYSLVVRIEEDEHLGAQWELFDDFWPLALRAFPRRAWSHAPHMS